MVVIIHYNYYFCIINHPKFNIIKQLFCYACGFWGSGTWTVQNRMVFTALPFLMPQWDDLNTGGNLIILEWNHLKVSSFINLVIWLQLLPVNSSIRKLTCGFSICSFQVEWFGKSHIMAARFQAQAIQEHKAEVHCILWLSIELENISSALRQEKGIRGIRTGMGEIQLLLSGGNMIIYKIKRS